MVLTTLHVLVATRQPDLFCLVVERDGAEPPPFKIDGKFGEMIHFQDLKRNQTAKKCCYFDLVSRANKIMCVNKS